MDIGDFTRQLIEMSAEARMKEEEDKEERERVGMPSKEEQDELREKHGGAFAAAVYLANIAHDKVHDAANLIMVSIAFPESVSYFAFRAFRAKLRGALEAVDREMAKIESKGEVKKEVTATE